MGYLAKWVKVFFYKVESIHQSADNARKLGHFQSKWFILVPYDGSESAFYNRIPVKFEDDSFKNYQGKCCVRLDRTIWNDKEFGSKTFLKVNLIIMDWINIFKDVQQNLLLYVKL